MTEHPEPPPDTPDASAPPDGAEPWPTGVVLGREACTSLLRKGLCHLGAAPGPSTASVLASPREAWLLDHAYAGWPLDEPAVLASLSNWLRRPGRRLRLVGTDFDALARACPRFARWRRDWTHCVDALAPPEGLLPAPLRGLWAGSLALQWLDAPEWRLRVLTQRSQVAPLHAECAAFLQRCEPSWPGTVLGL